MNTLKDFSKNTKGWSFWNKFKEFFWYLRYAWLRAWRGYDDIDVFNLNDSLIKRMLPILSEFKKYNVGLWFDYHKNVQLDKEQTDNVIQTMIDLLGKCDPDIWVDMGLTSNENLDQINQIVKEAYANQKKFLKLLTYWFDNLWY